MPLASTHRAASRPEAEVEPSVGQFVEGEGGLGGLDGERTRLFAVAVISSTELVAAAIAPSRAKGWGNSRSDTTWSPTARPYQPSASRAAAHPVYDCTGPILFPGPHDITNRTADPRSDGPRPLRTVELNRGAADRRSPVGETRRRGSFRRPTSSNPPATLTLARTALDHASTSCVGTGLVAASGGTCPLMGEGEDCCTCTPSRHAERSDRG